MIAAGDPGFRVKRAVAEGVAGAGLVVAARQTNQWVGRRLESARVNFDAEGMWYFRRILEGMAVYEERAGQRAPTGDSPYAKVLDVLAGNIVDVAEFSYGTEAVDDPKGMRAHLRDVLHASSRDTRLSLVIQGVNNCLDRSASDPFLRQAIGRVVLTVDTLEMVKDGNLHMDISTVHNEFRNTFGKGFGDYAEKDAARERAAKVFERVTYGTQYAYAMGALLLADVAVQLVSNAHLGIEQWLDE